MEVRRYEKNFLHAKAYIFSKNPDKEKNCDDVIIAGSSNLTSAGLSSNLELNLGRYDDITVSKGKNGLILCGMMQDHLTWLLFLKSCFRLKHLLKFF